MNYQKFTQHPELGQKLIETNNAQLGYYEPDDNQLGIGISLDSEDSKYASKWTGQNWVGNALEQVRTAIKATKASVVVQPVQQPQEVQRRRPRVATVVPSSMM